MRRISFFAAAIVLVAIIMAAPFQAQVVKPVPPIQIDSGMLAGKVLDSGVKAWLGIPYAKAPVGELRWKEPQPITWKGIYNADRKMSESIQVLRPHNINHYFGEEPSSEDCLYMNIWAPANAKATSKLPVIAYIYGGGGTIGSSGSALYDGEQVARRGAIFVNFNYRVGILGFMAHPELTKEQGGHSGNYGYLDQNAALKWINHNIAKFGGDPAKVIISGQSAGAGSVVQQTFSPLSKGLFRGAVMMSGCNWTGENTPLATAEKTGLEIQKLLKANNLDDMRQVPADRILALQSESQVGVSRQGVRTGAVIDGYFMPNAGILVDTLHFDRSNSSIEELKKLPREWFRYAHVCDAPREKPTNLEGLLHEARAERMFPGDGRIDVRSILACLPPDIPYALEIPGDALAGQIGLEEYACRALRAAQKFLNEPLETCLAASAMLAGSRGAV